MLTIHNVEILDKNKESIANSGFQKTIANDKIVR